MRPEQALHALCCLFTVAILVLRMLSDYVGEEKFLKGVSIYLKKHLYANTVTHNLWEGIQEASGTYIAWSDFSKMLMQPVGIDIPKVMDSWVKKVWYRAVVQFIPLTPYTAPGRIPRPDRDGGYKGYTRPPGSFPQHGTRTAEGQRNDLDGASQPADYQRQRGGPD